MTKFLVISNLLAVLVNIFLIYNNFPAAVFSLFVNAFYLGYDFADNFRNGKIAFSFDRKQK